MVNDGQVFVQFSNHLHSIHVEIWSGDIWAGVLIGCQIWSARTAASSLCQQIDEQHLVPRADLLVLKGFIYTVKMIWLQKYAFRDSHMVEQEIPGVCLKPFCQIEGHETCFSSFETRLLRAGESLEEMHYQFLVVFSGRVPLFCLTG